MMAHRTPLARKNLLQDRRRAVLAVGGVAASLVLVLVLDGVFAGAMHQVNAYMRNSPADVFIAQRDVRTMHMTQSQSRWTSRSISSATWGLLYGS